MLLVLCNDFHCNLEYILYQLHMSFLILKEKQELGLNGKKKIFNDNLVNYYLHAMFTCVLLFT